MKKNIIVFALAIMPIVGIAQDKLWTEGDRKYLLDNLTRNRDELIKETENLSEKQWNFREAPDRWTIGEVVEHLALYEVVFDTQISMALSAKPQPELNKSANPDSVFYNFIMESKPHFTKDYGKPYTTTVPMGLNPGKNNLAWIVKMRNESIEYLKTTTVDLRAQYVAAGRPNPHQTFIYVFGHVDRALRQIKKIKANAKYPKG